MDIEYLLALQNIRSALGGSLDEFFNAVSNVGRDHDAFALRHILVC